MPGRVGRGDVPVPAQRPHPAAAAVGPGGGDPGGRGGRGPEDAEKREDGEDGGPHAGRSPLQQQHSSNF